MLDAAKKIHSLNELKTILQEQRAQGKTIAHCHGVFDLIHVGHIRHLKEARSLADVLVVTITPDRFVNKGPGRPAFGESHRLEALAALEDVDFVALNEWPNSVETVNIIQPTYYVKGPDYKDARQDITGGIDLEREAVERNGGRLVITDDVTFSSSTLINRYLPVFSEEVQQYLSAFQERHRTQDVLHYLDGARDMKVLVVGEAIIDEYQYCNVIGKSSKEPVLAARLTDGERFAGGSLAVANHLADFCKEVRVVVFIGADDPGAEAFIQSSLKPNVYATILTSKRSPTIVKKRYVEGYLMQKLFETYQMDEHGFSPDERANLNAALEDIMPNQDVVIAVDYGHGMIEQDTIDLLAAKAPFLAVNTQLNAGNQGFNTLSKYPRADYACISGGELALETRNKQDPDEALVTDVLNRIDCPRMTITRGKAGSLCYHNDEGFVEIPAMAPKVVDRIGAGDAVLAITSLCAKQGASSEILGFIGNVVGAEAVQIVGNRRSIERVPLSKHIQTLMK